MSSAGSSLMRRQDSAALERKTPITRVRTGCLTCRRRRKKCDGRKPSCQNCQRTNLCCEGYPAPVIWSPKRNGSSPNPAASSGGLLSSNNTEFNVAEWSNDGRSAVNQPNMLDTYIGFASNQFESPAFTDLEHFPVVGSYKSPVRQSDNRSQTQTRTQRRLLPELPFLIAGVETAIHRRLFHHFTEVLSTVLTTVGSETNPFNSVVLPLALGDKPIMQTLLSLSGSHLANQYSATNPELSAELGAERLRLHGDVLRAQIQRTVEYSDPRINPLRTSPTREQEAMFSTSLLLCLYEICEGTSDDSWRTHLNAARQILTSTSVSQPNGLESQGAAQTMMTEMDPFLLEFFQYHDSIADVTAPSHLFNKPRFRSVRDVSEKESSVVGVQDGLIQFVTRISAARAEAEASPRKPDGFVIQKAVSIWKDLHKWRPDPSLPKERQLIAEIYQWALFIWLYSILYPEGRADAEVQNYVRKIAAEINNIKVEHGLMSCLLFPLFLVGTAAISAEDREAISGQFKRLRDWSGLGNVALTHCVVKGMWEEYDNGVPNSWDWVNQMRAHGMSFLVT